MRGSVIGAGAALAGLVGSAAIARSGHVPPWEEAAFRRCNRGPAALRRPAWITMQCGSYGAVIGATVATKVARGQRAAAAVFAGGTGVWLGVKVLKPAVGRGRPDAHLDDVSILGRPQNGLGYPSGHAAVSTTLALLTTRPGRLRALALTGAGLVGCGRIHAGAHLPLDVVGGLALGALVGLGTDAVRR